MWEREQPNPEQEYAGMSCSLVEAMATGHPFSANGVSGRDPPSDDGQQPLALPQGPKADGCTCPCTDETLLLQQRMQESCIPMCFGGRVSEVGGDRGDPVCEVAGVTPPPPGPGCAPQHSARLAQQSRPVGTESCKLPNPGGFPPLLALPERDSAGIDPPPRRLSRFLLHQPKALVMLREPQRARYCSGTR